MKAGERVLLPRVRESAPGTLVVTDGFSCREQIAQSTGRHAYHLAELLDIAFRFGRQDYRLDGIEVHGDRSVV
jgi:hypothetical protein